ncbi:carbohydrate ABC transporter permease [Ruminococcus sp. RTP21484sp1]|jgi:raffinose/stachyose/melibiose transport system permease protein|uniref:carbohydrate ABC transporter permease n=1 Tax=Ruminococcus sp. RTP21484sp1 TaxID=3151395 RepID=UPI00321A2EF5
MKGKKRKLLIADILVLAGSLLIFGVPLYFLVVNSFKTQKDARQLSISWPKTFAILENYKEAFSNQHYMIVRAFFNSVIITFFTVVGLLIICSMAGYVIQRRKDKVTKAANTMILTGLMIPPAIMPTIWVMQKVSIYKTIPGMILVEIALGIPFTIMLFRGYMGAIPREIEEAAMIDGCGRFRIFFSVIAPLLTPIASTIVILQAVTVFNDFVNPLYFLPGNENVTIQLTVYNFMGKFSNKYNLLFADIVIVTIPMLLLFIFFNKKIIDGMAAGAVKG